MYLNSNERHVIKWLLIHANDLNDLNRDVKEKLLIKLDKEDKKQSQPKETE